MKPFDRRLLTEVPAARPRVAGLAALSCLDGVVSIAAAITGAGLVWAVVSGSDELRTAITRFVVVLLAKALIAAATERQAALTGVTVATELRAVALARWSASTLDDLPDAEDRAARVTLGAASVEPYVARYLPALVSAAVVPALALLTLLVVDPISALIVVLTLPLLPIFAALIGQHTRDETQRKWKATQQLTSHFSDVMRGLPTLVNYQRAEVQVSRIEVIGDRLRRSTVQTLRTAFLSSAALELLTTISVAIVAVSVGLRLTHGSMGLAAGLIAILVAPEAYWPIRRVGQEFHAAADGLQAIDRLLPAVPVPSPNGTGPAGTGPSRWVDRVDYRHRGASTDVLTGIDLDEVPGLQVIAGESGAGKTTLLEVVAGLRRPTAGRVAARRVALVSQRPVLVPGSLADNLGEPAALARRSPALARLAAGLVASLPDGELTVIGDDGVGLSAGQRHLVATCRAVSGEAEVILLDEPTAHLDPDRADELITALVELAGEVTVVVVSHDQRVIMAAARVVTLPSRRSAGTGLIHHERGGTDRTPEPAASRPDNSPQIPTTGPRSLLPAIALGTVASCCGVALTAASGWLIVKASTQPVILTLLTAVVSVRAFGIFRPVFRHWERLSSHDVALARLAARRAQVFAALIPLTPAALGRRRRGEVLAAAARDVDDEIDALPRGIVPVLTTSMTAALGLLGASLVLPRAGLVLAVALAILAVIGLVAHRWERGRHQLLLDARGQVETVARLSAELGPVMASAMVADTVARQLGEAVRGQVGATAALARVRATVTGVVQVWVGVTTAVIAVVVATAVADQRLSPMVAAMVVLGPLALTQLLTGLPDAISALNRGRAARLRVTALTSQTRSISDPLRPVDLRDGELSVELVQVSASWTGGPLHLRDCSLRVDAGTMVAITGPNGSGKSTALAVVAMQLAAAEGQVRHRDQDAAAIRLDEVRRQLAILDDEPHLFAGDLRANLLLAKPDADVAELREAVTRAGLAGWFAGLPQGFSTELGVGARGLSGGERARLGLARALLSQRPVILLDEPVAHLDHPTASAVMADLAATLPGSGHTLLLVSHQDIGVHHCDRVVSFSEQKEEALCR